MIPSGPRPDARFTRQDARALLALAALFLLMALASWQRWTQPLLDHGREMNLPARIAAGERLYDDVQFLYGPFAPYFNALLYRLFGVHLAVLKIAGAASALWILSMAYALSRRLMNPLEAAVTTGLVLVICALKSTANYIQPYAYAALYGTGFALTSLQFTMRHLEEGASRRRADLLLAGLLAGFALISKPEIALATLAAAAAALVAKSWRERQPAWQDAIGFAAGAVLVPVVAYALVLRHVSLQVLLERNHILFSNMPPQLVYFNQHISGIAQWPGSLWFSLTGIGIFAIWVGIIALIGGLASIKTHASWREAVFIGAALVLLGGLWRDIALRLLSVPPDITPFACAAFLLPALIVLLGREVWRRREDVARHEPLLALLVFAFVSILRAILNLTTTGPYAPFFLPAVIIVYLYLLLIVAPALLASHESVQHNIRRTALCLLGLLVLGMGINSAIRFRRLNTYLVSSARGSFLTSPEIGAPLAEAIRFAEERTAPGAAVAALPIATTINFMAARAYPLREEIVHPGFLTGAAEDDAIERLRARRVPLLFIANLDTSEFRDRTFGVDYNRKLVDWILRNYHLAARFDSPHQGTANFGREPFFITAYELNED